MHIELMAVDGCPHTDRAHTLLRRAPAGMTAMIQAWAWAAPRGGRQGQAFSGRGSQWSR